MAPTNADAGQLSGLLKGASLEDHQERLDRADATLRSHPGDLAAAHTKVVALLNLDRFDDAVKAIDAGGPQLQRRCALERAYGLYKAGRLDDAAKAAREGSAATGNSTASAASRKRAFDHVAAQVAYRAERFDVAAAIYPRLVAAGYGAAANDGEENDLKINLLATASQLEWQGRGFVLDRQWKQPARGDLDVFETAYNAGCACLARWDFERAAILLKRARQLCEASDELDDEEKEAEVQSIIIQQICESIYAGRTDDAKELLSKAISKEESTDEAAKILLRANSMVAGSEGRNPYLTQRIASSLKKAKESKELLRFQSSRLASNAAVADIKAEKPNSVRSGKLQGVAKAAVATEKPTKRQRIKALRKLAEKDPENVGLILTVVQLVIKEENVAYATTILEALFQGLGKGRSTEKLDVRYSPGLVALAVSLYRSQGWHMRARSELAKAARHWQSRGGGLPDSMSDDGNRNWKSANTLLRDAGIELLRSTDESDLRLARDAFSRLTIAGADARDRTQQKQQPSGEDDRLAAAGLVAAAATTDFAAVEPHLALLTPAETLVAGVDVDALVDAGVASVAPATSAAASRKKRAVEQQQPAAKRRRRLRKLPKDYEEGKKMDPERWLPQRDRSYYRPKGKKAKKRALESTQGGVVKEVGEMLELVGGAGAVRVEKAPAPGGGSKSKKKGKGKK